MSDIVNKYSLILAKELAERKLYNVDEVVPLIASYLRMAHKDLVSENINHLEAKRNDIMRRLKAVRLNSPEYVKIGYELAAVKAELAPLNRNLHESRREDKVAELQQKLSEAHDHEDRWKERFKEVAPEAYEQFLKELKARL